MQVLYFAWLRERIGQSSEEVETAAARPTTGGSAAAADVAGDRGTGRAHRRANP